MINISEDFPGYNTIKPMIESIKSNGIILEKDPENIDAQIGLADSYFALWCYGIITYAEAIEEVKAANKPEPVPISSTLPFFRLLLIFQTKYLYSGNM